MWSGNVRRGGFTAMVVSLLSLAAAFFTVVWASDLDMESSIAHVFKMAWLRKMLAKPFTRVKSRVPPNLLSLWIQAPLLSF